MSWAEIYLNVSEVKEGSLEAPLEKDTKEVQDPGTTAVIKNDNYQTPANVYTKQGSTEIGI